MNTSTSREVQEALDRLIGAVDVDNFDSDEYDTLAKLMVSAGLMWRCWDRDCGCINHLDTLKCDNCDARRPKAREVPQPELMRGISIDYDRRQKKLQREVMSLNNTKEIEG